MITRLVLYSTLGMLCSALGYAWDTWQFMCILGLFWACDQLAQREGKQAGYIEGIWAYMNMTDANRKRIEKLVKEVRNEQ